MRGQRLGVLAIGAVLAASVAPAREVPFLSGRVNDTSGILSEGVRQGLEEKLAAYEKETGAQVAVLTIDSLEGEVLEDYSHRVATTWQLGRKGVDDGVLFLVAKNDRKMRLEVGYGLEGKLTDAQSRRILDNLVRPQFRAGSFDGGVQAGVDAVLGTLRGEDVIPPEAPPGSSFKQLADVPWPMRLAFGGMFTLVIGMFSLVALFGKGCSGWFLYFFLMPFYLTFPMVFAGPVGGLVIFVAWVVGFPILKLMLSFSPWGKLFMTRHPGLARFATSSGSSGRGWSSGGSSSGWSGGGGSFGGGGSSSSW